jgi:glycine/D-amino acid oxidase-like deaminating enzyme
MTAAPFPLAPSLWAATAPPAPPTPPLAAPVATDVCVVGGGYCGLSAALHLAEAGVRTVLLEAEEPGWGASGRNGGQVIPGLKHDPDALAAMFPGEAGERLIRFAGGTADFVFDLIERHRMEVPRRRAGWIQGAHNRAALAEAAARAEQWARRGVASVALGRAATAEKLGTDRYPGGWLDPRGGAVQPLAYARGLARAAIAAGAAIHGGTRATALARRNGRWHVATAAGASVTAEQVLLATNGYTGDLWPGLRRSIVAMNSFQVATLPLSDNLRASVLPEGHVTSDTRRLLLYFRLDHEGRLLMGGRGPLREPSGPADWGHLERVLAKMFPHLAGTPIAFRWCGRVALTRDFLPHLHAPAPGLIVDIGCMGRGIGLQSAMGAAIARYLQNGDAEALPFPLLPVRPIPLHGMQKVYLSGIIAWYRMTDAGLV